MNHLKLIEEECFTRGIYLEPEVVLAFLEEIREDPETVRIRKGYDHSCDFEIMINGETYWILDEDLARQVAHEDLYDFLTYESGYKYLNLNLMHYLKKSFIEDFCEDYITNFVYSMDEDESAEYLEEYDLKFKDDLVEAMVITLAGLDYLQEILSDEEILDFADKHDGFLIEELIDDILSLDGYAPTLSPYDGKEIEFTVDDKTYYAYRRA